jgi:hypothetical protein
MRAPSRGGCRPTILFSEGSSTSARQTLETFRGKGYRILVCDPKPLCLCRFSGLVEKVVPCPSVGADPVSYLAALERVIRNERVDVLLPNHEQTYLFSKAADRLARRTGIALSDFEAMRTLFGKVRFLELLDRLGLDHPQTTVYDGIEDVSLFPDYPFYIKTEIGTASQGVFRVASHADLQGAVAAVRSAGSRGRILVQEECRGSFENVYALFDASRLVACHCSRRTVEGLFGGHVVRTGVDRPAVARDIARIGEALGWRGCVAFDYFYDAAADRATYIDASPRLVELMNAFVNGTDIPDLQVKLSLEGHVDAQPVPTKGLSTFSIVQGLLATASRSGSRGAVIREYASWKARRGIYREGTEELTDPASEPESWIPLLALLARLIAKPGSAASIGRGAIEAYALTEVSIEIIDRMAR